MTNSRLNFPALQRAFADTSQTQLRAKVSNIANRLLALLGGDPGDVTPPGVPTNLVATPGITQVALTWTPPSDLDVAFYRVQRSTTSGSGFSVITTVIGTSLIDSGLTGGTAYYYKVAAVDTSGNVGDYSSEVSATPVASPGSGTPPAAPANLVAVAGDTEVALQWDLVEGAVSYIVQRSTTSGSGFSTVAQGIVGAPGQTYAVWLDTGRTNGTTYYYIVKALNANGDTSAASNEASATPVAAADTTAPPLPTSVALTALTGAIKVNWDAVVVGDLAKYKVYWSLVADDEYETVDVLPGPNNTAGSVGYVIPDLEEETEYFVFVTAEDTSGNAMSESEALATLGEPYSTTTLATPIVYTTPAAPQNFRVTSVGDGQVSFAWDPVTSPYMASYIAQMRPDPSQPWGQPPGAVVPFPTTVLTLYGLTNNENYQFRIFARNEGGLTSEPSNVVNATPSNGNGPGTFDVGLGTIPGGSNTTAGAINGDTGLGPNHRAPGATFDFVVDASHLTSGSLFAMIGQMTSEIHNAAVLSGGQSGFDMTGKRIAILLPERVYRLQDSDPNHSMVQLWGSGWNRDSAQMPRLDDTAWHFIGPWPTADIVNDTSLDAKAAQKKFVLRSTTPEGYAYSAGPADQGVGLIDIQTHKARVRVGFWFMELEGARYSWISGQAPRDVMAGGGFVQYHGVDFTQPNHFPNIDSSIPGGGAVVQGERQNESSIMPRFGISTYRLSHDVIDYCTFDSPYTYEHCIYERNAPSGPAYIRYTDFYRTGGQVLQETRRNGSNQGTGDEGLSLSTGEASTRYWRNCVIRHWGRSVTRSAAAITQYGSHRIQDFKDCVFINNNPGKVNWPPSNLETLATDEYCDGPYAENTNSAFIFFAGGGVWPMNDGHLNPGMKMRDCFVWLKKPDSGAIVALNAKTIDIADSIICQDTYNYGITATLYGNDGGTSPYAIDSILLEDNNTSALLAAFRTDYSDYVPVSPILDGVVRYFAPPPLNGDRAGTPGNPITSGAPINGARMNTASVNITNLQ